MFNRYKHTLAVFVLVIAAAGCAHRPAYRDPLFFETLGRDTEMMVTMRMDSVRDLIVYAFPQLQGGEMDTVFDRGERVSVAAQTAPGDHEVRLYGGIEGNIPRFLTRTALSASSDWERTRDGFVYYRDVNSGFEISVPKRGIIVFADKNLPSVHDRMTSDRVLYVPSEITQRFIEADAAFYSSNPDGMNLFGERVSFPFELFFDEMWITVNRVGRVIDLDTNEETPKALYHVEGIITLPENVQARVFDRVIKVMYQDYMRKRNMDVKDWRVTINLKQNTVVFDNLLIYEDIIQEVFRITAR